MADPLDELASAVLSTSGFGMARWSHVGANGDPAGTGSCARPGDCTVADHGGGEIVDQEDLAWSLPDGSYVEVAVVSAEPLVVRLDASKGLGFRRIAATRIVPLDSTEPR